MKQIEIEPIGPLQFSEDLEWYVSRPIKLSLLSDREMAIAIEGYDEDGAKEDFTETVKNLLAAKPQVLQDVSHHLHAYFLDQNNNEFREDDDQIEISDPEKVWEYIDFGDEIKVERRGYGDEGIYASLECSCDWEDEHGLQIVLKNGNVVCKVGPYDGHPTNSDAYDDDSFEEVIYVPTDELLG